MNMQAFMSVKGSDLFSRNIEQIFSLKEWEELLVSGKKLRIKYGVDVTAPLLHIGHGVNMWMMRHLQDLGHTVVFLIGDFTTQIGDPTGRDKTRPVISQEEIVKNTDEFIQQAKMILRFDNPALLEIRKNSEWFGSMPTKDFLKLLSAVTHSRLISRDMFQKRISESVDIYMHELLYPVLQGYDSVVLQSDLTIVGSDQLFNENLGRFYQERAGQRQQVVITTKITSGIDGKGKQSKSVGNFIGLGHSARDKFGRAMSIPDRLIREYLSVYTDVSTSELNSMEKLVTEHPMEAKKKLAFLLVQRYHGTETAEAESLWFDTVFSQRNKPGDILKVVIPTGMLRAEDVLRECFAGSKSNSDIRRLFVQGAISVNDVKVIDHLSTLKLHDDSVIKAGKRLWFKIALK